MFTPGRIVFASLFLLAFIVLMIWSYRKDSKVNRIHFAKPYRVLLALLGFVMFLLLLVKLKQYL